MPQPEGCTKDVVEDDPASRDWWAPQKIKTNKMTTTRHGCSSCSCCLVFRCYVVPVQLVCWCRRCCLFFFFLRGSCVCMGRDRFPSYGGRAGAPPYLSCLALASS